MASKPFYEPGNYVAEVVQQALGEAKTGTPQFVLRVKILGKPDPGDDQALFPVTQYERTIYLAITDRTIEYFSQHLETLGFTGSSFSQLDPGHNSHQSFAGKQIDVYCKHEADQQGDMRDRWSISSGSSKALEVTPLASKKVRELDALFGKNLRKPPVAKPNGSTTTEPMPPPASKPFTEEITDDDIPW